jgi:hypothetical protein
MDFSATDFDHHLERKDNNGYNENDFLDTLKNDIMTQDRIEVLFKYGYKYIDNELFKIKKDLSRYSNNVELSNYIQSIRCNSCRTFGDAVNKNHILCLDENIHAKGVFELNCEETHLRFIKFILKEEIRFRNSFYDFFRYYSECYHYSPVYNNYIENFIFINAARNGHLECIKYAYDIFGRPEYGQTEICQYAAQYGHFECLKFIHEHKFAWNSGTCSAAAEKDVKCLKYAHENGCEWYSDVYNSAIRGNNIDCINYAFDNGCPITCHWIGHHS